MGLTERYFQMGSEQNVIHLPYRPNGFGIFILGDRTHFVGDETSFWLQHYGRNQLLNMLREEGYTIFNSNLYGRHWGAEKAVTYAKQLIHFVLKQEILNQKIHILADGMGALVADELLRFSPEHIRSAAMLNPCLDLQAHYESEKENKFFYKQFLKEAAESYGITEKEAAERSYKTIKGYPSRLPVHIWQRMTGAPYPYSMHAGVYKDTQKNAGCPVDITFHLFEHPTRIYTSICNFFHRHEKEL
ncbi:hypothetical protein P8907_08035 [Bacillus atrophaeus]|uniref:hypothetical protein n=1 Tax=Bacillus atrophaeus TaxID=1452 RepID=UPI00077AA701|nr:hypothetical protein [Bacillus atrophaeus]KXZ13997.1 hypothetical protein AXI57_11770 [Bacillus atrophaeus]MCY8838356.1 hypothetical protein [Bacillus atrophaeus]MCY8910251.1 hypothetical protein [Bacillus atrophaeus]MEC0835994.1 hypothetical protein [Bacillus atrophaeus]MEC0846956.1 hypothetical protein [Bacillus atrophaeus]